MEGEELVELVSCKPGLSGQYQGEILLDTCKGQRPVARTMAETRGYPPLQLNLDPI